MASQPQPARQQWHVFPKTFPMDQSEALAAYLKEWRGKGYDPKVVIMGRRFKRVSGGVADNRVQWVSLARYPSQAAAAALAAKLKKDSVFAWIRPETIEPGKGVVTVSDEKGKIGATLPLPLTLAGPESAEVADVDTGLWKERKKDHCYALPWQFGVGAQGTLELHGNLPLETYLRGVLPAEMPSSWPLEALKAQAIAARSEILSAYAGKYLLEGFDFTIAEDCRAYGGLSSHTAPTDKAVGETAGLALVRDGKVATTVFCACCGGWTEDNEVAWSGPANAVLRAKPDFPEDKRPKAAGPEAFGLARWITTRPPAWCSGHRDYRWQKRYTVQELSRLVNKQYAIGEVSALRMGDRGSGGRLRSLTIVGAKGTVRVERDVAIRKVFGGLPSTMIIINSESDKSERLVYNIVGAGYGHGVGLCQQGAKAMAEQGLTCQRILPHYFAEVAIERFVS